MTLKMAVKMAVNGVKGGVKGDVKGNTKDDCESLKCRIVFMNRKSKMTYTRKSCHFRNKERSDNEAQDEKRTSVQ